MPPDTHARDHPRCLVEVESEWMSFWSHPIQSASSSGVTGSMNSQATAPRK